MQTLYLSIILFCLLSLIGTVIYLFLGLNSIGIIISLILTLAFFIYLKKHFKLNWAKPKFEPSSWRDWLLIIYLAFWLFSFYILYKSRTGQVMISPWQVVDSSFFLVYTLSSALAVFALLKKTAGYRLMLCMHYFLSFSVALAVYSIGYGFDPFIHQASVKFIDQFGAILPKTPYYLGQYSLIVIIHKITFIPLIWLDKLLVPLTAAIFLPWTACKILPRIFDNKIITRLLILISLILPFAFFIITTPQGFAYVLLIMIILLGLIANKKKDFFILYLLALTSMAVQPIVGIPALIFTAALHSYKSSFKLKKEILIILIAANIFILPALFYSINKTNAVEAPVNSKAAVAREVDSQLFAMPNNEEFWLNFAYLYEKNIILLVVLLIIIGMAYARIEKKQPWMIYSAQASALLIAYALTKNLSFDFLINYERDNYADRI
ncbi:MAG: hypothetical protein ABIG10_04075, partial [bacterium]